MACQHLKKLYQLCEQNSLKLSGSDVIQIVCRECGQVEVCPSVLMDEYEQKQVSKDMEELEPKEIAGKIGPKGS